MRYRIRDILGTQLARDHKNDDLSTSICEAAMTSFSESDDSLAGLIEQYAIDVRDFMMLSLVCDQETFAIDQLGRALGLSPETTGECIERLTDAGLVKHNGVHSVTGDGSEVRTTVAGRVLARRILDKIG